MTYKQVTKAKYLKKEINSISKYYDRLITSKNSLSRKLRVHNSEIDKNMDNIEEIKTKLIKKYNHLFHRLNRFKSLCDHKTPNNNSAWVFTNNPTGHKSECQICSTKRW